MTKPSNTKDSKLDSSGKKPLYYRDDEDFIRELIWELIRRKRYVRRESKYHIKVRKVNFWPSTGTITVDGQGRHHETGTEAFLKLLDARYPKGPGPRINPFENLTLSEKLRTAPIFDVSLDDVDDLCKDRQQDPSADLPL
ncbi:hypothetical protein JJB98_01080 [Bradyrhizobium diazoefficiens]|nr:hypothetical protein [Bradyrhizobium diazoefficiens]QQO18606.1 hypothetical protein JJB98_01080 [Bradyrhizobium diazoefficiens]